MQMWFKCNYPNVFLQSQEVFIDAANVPTIRKKVKTMSAVEPSDSRAVWRYVTEAMLRGDSEAASEAKHTVNLIHKINFPE